MFDVVFDEQRGPLRVQEVHGRGAHLLGDAKHVEPGEDREREQLRRAGRGKWVSGGRVRADHVEPGEKREREQLRNGGEEGGLSLICKKHNNWGKTGNFRVSAERFSWRTVHE